MFPIKRKTAIATLVTRLANNRKAFKDFLEYTNTTNAKCAPTWHRRSLFEFLSKSNSPEINFNSYDVVKEFKEGYLDHLIKMHITNDEMIYFLEAVAKAMLHEFKNENLTAEEKEVLQVLLNNVMRFSNWYAINYRFDKREKFVEISQDLFILKQKYTLSYKMSKN